MVDYKVTQLDDETDFDQLEYWDVVIIGAGPAGLAAGLTTAHFSPVEKGVRKFPTLSRHLENRGCRRYVYPHTKVGVVRRLRLLLR